MKIPMMIAVRGFAVRKVKNSKSKKEKTNKGNKRDTLKKPSAYSVTFDTETGTDHAQHLRIGTYQVRKRTDLIEKGIFYEPDNVAAEELKLLTAYTKKKGLTLRTREDFVREIIYRYGYKYGGLILGFNLPFDLSRLAISGFTSHGWDMRGGFSLELLPEKWMPNILVKHLNSRAAFMRFAAAPRIMDGRGMRRKQFKTESKTGYFQDLKTLAAALLGGSFNLKRLADLLEIEHRKLETEEHGGPLTAQYLDYAVNDTDVTWDCYVALLARYEEHGLAKTPPHRIYSEASLGKAYLREMIIEAWLNCQKDFEPELLGIIMNTYFGGRAEIRIRRQVTRVLYCDFRSMYPTVCTKMGLWRYVIATGVEHQDWTAETADLLEKSSLADLQKPDFWTSLTVLVQIAPDNDVLPVRARYAESARTIGLNHLSSEQGHWFTLADCLASKLLTGKAPTVLKAIRFAPKEPQSGLQPITIGGNAAYRIDPYKDDFYRRVIELRGQIQQAAKQAFNDGRIEEAVRLDSYQQMLKLLANSTSYGIFAEMNVQSYDRPRSVSCFGMEKADFGTDTKSIEEPGTHFHPLLATLITGAARLMLATAERLAEDNGIGWALCDTDSLALARPDGMADEEFLERAIKVTKWFDALSPYNDAKPLFKIEDHNYRLDQGKVVPGVHEPLYALAISAKRYVLFNLDHAGKPIIRKALAHGLGHWLAPYTDENAPASIPAPAMPLSEIGCDRWHHDLWYQIILAELEGHPDRVDYSMLPDLDQPAASRYAASTSALLHWFDKFNADRPYPDQVKAFNFMLAFQVSKSALYEAAATGDIDAEFLDDGVPAVVAPYDSDRKRAASRCFDRRTGRPVPVTILATYGEAISDYHLHSESKFENGELFARGVTRRRHVQAVAVEYIGKEANRWEEQFFLGAAPEAQIEYGNSPAARKAILKVIKRAARKFGMTALADAAQLSRQQLTTLIGKKGNPRPATIVRLMRAVAELEIAWNNKLHLRNGVRLV